MASAQPARSRSPSGRPRKPVSRPPRDRRDNSNSDLVLRLGNFNVLNLVNPGITFYGKNHYTPQQVDRKIQWIANQLRHMKAGICGFEEVFSTEPLQKAIELSGFYGPQARLINYGANGSGPTVALVSNYPVLESVSIPDFPPEAMLTTEAGALPIKKFSRPVLKCVIKLNSGDIITVFVAHLKSKRPIVPDELRHSATAKAVGHALSLIHRAAESAALRCLVVDDIRKNNRPVVVLGDLNDTVHSVTTEIVSGTQPWKKLPFDQKQEIWETLLWSTNEVQVRASDRDVTYSHIHNGRYEVLDHVLVSQDFVRTYPDHFGEVQYLQLFNDHLVDATLSDDFGDPCESDHGQIVAHIKIFPREDAPRSPAAAPAHAAGASPALAAAHAAPAVVPVVGATAPAPAPASPAPHTAHPSHPSATALAAAHAAAPAAPAATPAVPVVAVTTPAPAPAKP